MTTKEFDKKYAEYLTPGFDGMEFEDPEIIDLCDQYFQEWIKIPEFDYQQIKSKFGTSRVYCGVGELAFDTSELEKKINKILRNHHG